MTTIDATATTDLLEHVCQVLPPKDGWTATRDTDTWGEAWRIQGPVFALFARHDEKLARLNVSLSIPPELASQHYGREYPSIHTGLCRTPIAIAHDIQRRLLPAATELYAKLVERKTSADEYERRRRTTIDAVADALNVPHVRQENGFNQTCCWSAVSASGQHPRARAKATGDTVDLDIEDISLPVAIAICHLLRAEATSAEPYAVEEVRG